MQCSDNSRLRQGAPVRGVVQNKGVAWALQTRAASENQPGRLAWTLTGAILVCGASVLAAEARCSARAQVTQER
jgi:hypothetical protein